MADPVSAMVIGATAFKAIGAISSGNAAGQAGDYNAQVNERNAAIVRSQAAMAAGQQERSGYKKLGAMRAAYGASGVSGTDGSALDVLADSASQAELDRQNILYRGDLQAMGYSDQAALDRFGAKNARRKGYMDAAGIIMGGAGQMAQMGKFDGMFKADAPYKPPEYNSNGFVGYL